jgi:hypothetical protein
MPSTSASPIKALASKGIASNNADKKSFFMMLVYLDCYYFDSDKYKKTWTNYFVYVSEVSANTYAPYPSKSPRRPA